MAARVAGVDLPANKKVKIGLRSIFGVGPHYAMEILRATNINPEKRTSELTDTEVNQINAVIEASYEVEGTLRQKIFRNIKRLKDIRSYRGHRHKIGMPVRGQNTRTNAVTRKGKNIAVGGLKRKLEKT
ncbi:MAG: 30S ribosomal protein S13 [Candidatus Dojkabacteria bacterium]